MRGLLDLLDVKILAKYAMSTSSDFSAQNVGHN